MLPRCRQPKRKGRTKTWITRTINHSYKENFSFNPDAHPLQQLHLFNISPSSVFLPADYRRFQEQNNGNRFWLWLGFKRCKTTASTQRLRQIDFGLIQKSISIAVLSVKRNVELLMDEAMNKFFMKKMNFCFPSLAAALVHWSLHSSVTRKHYFTCWEKVQRRVVGGEKSR